MNLYKLITRNIGYYYVVANDPNNAVEKLSEKLKDSEIEDRSKKVIGIEILAESDSDYRPFIL